MRDKNNKEVSVTKICDHVLSHILPLAQRKRYVYVKCFKTSESIHMKFVISKSSLQAVSQSTEYVTL